MEYPRYIYAIYIHNYGVYIGIACDVKRRVRAHLSCTDECQKYLTYLMKTRDWSYRTIDIVNSKEEEIKEYLHMQEAINLGLTVLNKNTGTSIL